jgi:HPt (histidine-containing phosphotransfer) domain-containing protein
VPPPGSGDSRRAAEFSPLDLNHLKLQTAGDRRLEAEVLSLFLAKTEADFARIRAAASAAERREAAHGLLGSARAVGAHEVARLAQTVERGGSETDVAMLGRAVAEARAYVRERLGLTAAGRGQSGE